MKRLELDGVVTYDGLAYKVVILDDGNLALEVVRVATAPSPSLDKIDRASERIEEVSASSPSPQALTPNNGFKARLTSVLTDNRYDRKLNKRKTGKLGMRNLWRVGVGESNVFTQKLARGGKAYHLVLVIDTSGSMDRPERVNTVEIFKIARQTGETYQAIFKRLKIRLIDRAVDVAHFLGINFEAVGIDLSVIGFSDYAEVYKAKADKLKPLDIQPSGGTDMLEGLKLAVKEFDNTARKLVIVISDGDTIYRDRILKLIQVNPDIEFFGIGIADTECSAIPQNKSIKDMAELQPVILDWLGRKIRRGV